MNSTAEALEAAIQSATTDDKPRATIIGELAAASEVSNETVESVLKGEIEAPDADLGKWAEILGTDKEKLTPPDDNTAASNSNVVPFDAKKAERSALDYAAEVHELCSLAGYADMAGEFIKAGTPIPQVRGKLREKQESDDAKAEVTSQHGGNQQQAEDQWRDVLKKQGLLKEGA